VKQANLREMLKRPSKVSLHQPVWKLLISFFPIPSTYSAMKTLENTAEDPHDPQPADEGYIKMEYSSD
jgi:hypothetical protein